MKPIALPFPPPPPSSTRVVPPPPSSTRVVPPPPASTSSLRVVPPPPPSPQAELPKLVADAPVAAGPVLATVNAHVRRVTLNLIRLSSVCPAPLAAVLEPLASRDWDFDTLSRADSEMIYALVDDQLADTAKSEFSANTTTIIDHRGDDAECKLCGHKHIRFEFRLENKKGGREVWTGSTCIIEYGLNVDGSATAEDALARLREAINQALRRAAREDWQREHPHHENDIEEVRKVSHAPLPYIIGNEWRFLADGYKRRWKEMVKHARAIVRYYDKEKFLTDKRTEQVYGPNRVTWIYKRMREELSTVRAMVEERTTYWRKAIDDYAPEGFGNTYRVLAQALYLVIAVDLEDEKPKTASAEERHRWEAAERAHNLLNELRSAKSA